MQVPTVFFAYPSQPNLRRETLVAAARQIGQGGEVSAHTWQDLARGAPVIIRTVLDAIDRAAVAVFDVTDLNENVLFELGYAIGKERMVWLLRDETVPTAARDWTRFGLLQGIRHVRYQNSYHIADAFWRERPDRQTRSVFSELLENSLREADAGSVLFLPGPHDTNSSRALQRRLEKERSRTFTVRVADPRESPVQPLAWYAQAIYDAKGVVAYFCSPQRHEGPIHNARMALLAGLALGMDKQVLMLAEEGYATPIDYQDLMYVFESSQAAGGHLGNWLRGHSAALRVGDGTRPSESLRLATELRSIRLGSHVAEDEADGLGDYFVTTQSFLQVLDGGVRLFIGRKGTGKSANLIRAAAELSDDVRNLVCVIKPAGYELDSLVRLLRRYEQKDTKAYLVQSLWKYLIFSELAKVAAEQILQKGKHFDDTSPEATLLELVDSEGFLGSEFAVRLEHAVDALLTVDKETGVAVGRIAIAEAMHDTLIRRLRDVLRMVLGRRHRVAILVDNLDKAWERDADFPHLSQLLLGLLGVMRSIAQDFGRGDTRREPADVSLAVFLRSDIYWHVSRNAREPDKLQAARLDWSDRALLRRVLEERYAAATGAEGETLWQAYFAPTVRGVATAEWVLDSVLPRPRDLLFLSNAAITTAVNRRHTRVEEEDLLDALKAYSSYAVDSILVEGQADLAELEAVIYEFAGAPERMTHDEVYERVRAARKKASIEGVIRQLRGLSFLGLGTIETQLIYSDDPQEQGRVDAIVAARAKYQNDRAVYAVHPAFRTFLGIAF